MATEFRCEKCGKLLSVDAEPGSTTRCPHCKKRVVIPAVLASLPHPQMPGASADAPPPPPGPAPAPAGDEPYDEEEEEEHGSDAVMGAMAHIMPWVISIFFHVGLALIMMFVAMIAVSKSMSEEVVIPSDVLSETPGGSVSPGKDNPMERAAQPTPTKSMGESQNDAAVPADDGKTDKPLKVIGSAAGGSRGGTLAPFGNRVGGSGAGPRSNFFGHGGNAHHICYVIDRSGSMVESFDRVRYEMLLSIGRLDPKQDFHVILFAKGTPKEAEARKLVPAIPRHKEDAAEFLDSVRAAGQTDPIPALQRAFNVLARADRRRPGKLVYLLTDGDFPDNKAVLADIRKHNTKKEVDINTYLYDYRGKQAVDVMRQIAKENGGRFKQISADEH